MIVTLGCTGYETKQGELVVKEDTNSFLEELKSNTTSIASTPLFPQAKTRAGMTDSSFNMDDYITLHVEFLSDATDVHKELLNYVQTIQDISDLHRITAAEFSIVPNGQKKCT